MQFSNQLKPNKMNGELTPIPEPIEMPTVQEYKPSNQEALREYEVKLQFLSRGCIVNVGCKAIAFEDVSNAMAELNEYVNNTYETQKKWRKLLNS